MHKKILVLLTGAIALSISAVPVLASDPPTDDGQYIWQDENGDYWYRKNTIFCPPSASTPRMPLTNGRKCMTPIWIP